MIRRSSLNRRRNRRNLGYTESRWRCLSSFFNRTVLVVHFLSRARSSANGCQSRFAATESILSVRPIKRQDSFRHGQGHTFLVPGSLTVLRSVHLRFTPIVLRYQEPGTRNEELSRRRWDQSTSVSIFFATSMSSSVRPPTS